MGREGFVRGLLLAAWVALSGCADGTHVTGFGSSGAPAIVPTGDVPASKSMATKYGITHWRMFSGVNHTVVTGYRADGTAARGVDLAWFKQAADGTPGHLRLTMLDGSGAIVRRYVGGKATGQLSADQMALVITQQVDFYEHFKSLVPAKHAKMRKHLSPLGGGGTLHLQDDGSGTSTAPNTGPECSAALAGGNTSGAGCVLSLSGTVLSSETILGGIAEGMHAVYECGDWAVESNEVQSTCETENTTHCTVAQDGGWENCDFSSEQTGDTGSSTAPSGGGLDQQTLCANYPSSSACSGLVQTNGFCSTSDQCAPGNECSQGFCSTAGYTGVPGDDCTNSDAVKYSGDKCSTSDAPTDQELQSSSNSSCLSCAPGSSDVTANPQNGDVSSGTGSDTSGSSSGGAGAGNGSSSGGGGSGDDPGGSLGNDTPSCGGQGGDCSGGGACCSPLVCDPGTSTCVTTDQMMGTSCTAYYGDACSSDSDCCLGTCDPSSSTCSSGGSSGGSSSSGSSSGGGSCASDGASCAADADCCSGTCDTSSGTCGSASGSSSGGSSSSGSSSGGSCTADGATCSTDAECCSGTCDPSTSTCGAASGSSSGSSGSSSGGGTCAADGSSCAADTDCCSGTCDTSTFTCGTGSGSSSGGSSSGSSSGGGSCTADGQSCASASDCCSQVCGSCDGLCGGNSAGASGAPCSSDADCCNSCDTTNGVCL